MKKRNKQLAWSRLSLAAPVLVAIIGACGGTTQGPQVGSESHFLGYCSGSCRGGLECIGEICTRPCLTATSSCSDLAVGAACTNQSVEPGQVAVCDLACNVADDCKALGAGYTCTSGFCRGSVDGIGTGGTRGTDMPGPAPAAQCEDYRDQIPPPIELPKVSIVNADTRTLYISFEGDCGNRSLYSLLDGAGQPVDLVGCAARCEDVMADSRTPPMGCDCVLPAPLPIAPGETVVRPALLAFASHVLPQACSTGLGPEGAYCVSLTIPPMGSVAIVKAYADPACAFPPDCPSITARGTGNYFFEDVTVVLDGSAE
jgi:hypothetical protein